MGNTSTLVLVPMLSQTMSYDPTKLFAPVARIASRTRRRQQARQQATAKIQMKTPPLLEVDLIVKTWGGNVAPEIERFGELFCQGNGMSSA